MHRLTHLECNLENAEDIVADDRFVNTLGTLEYFCVRDYSGNVYRYKELEALLQRVAPRLVQNNHLEWFVQWWNCSHRYVNKFIEVYYIISSSCIGLLIGLNVGYNIHRINLYCLSELSFGLSYYSISAVIFVLIKWWFCFLRFSFIFKNKAWIKKKLPYPSILHPTAILPRSGYATYLNCLLLSGFP